MTATMKVTNLTPHHKTGDGQQIFQVTLGATDGSLHGLNTYVAAEEATVYSVAMLTGKPLFRLTVEPEPEAA